MKSRFRTFFLLNLGTAMSAFGVYFFKMPNHFSTGGVTGAGIILGALFPGISTGTYILAINLFMLALGAVFVSRSFGLRTVYCSVLFSVLIRALEWIFPMTGTLTDDRMLELFFAVLIPAVGSAILFNLEASTGGTDIVAMILRSFTTLDIGRALLLSDSLIVFGALLTFGVKTGLFCILGLLLKSMLVDNVIESLNLRKSFMVITTHPHEICDYITHDLHRGATVWNARGAFTDEERCIILTALSRSQAVLLRRFVKGEDVHAFMLISNSSEIFGKGFMRV